MTERARTKPVGESLWLLALAMAMMLGWITLRTFSFGALNPTSHSLFAWAGYHFIDVVIVYLVMYFAYWRHISTARGAIYFFILYAVAMFPGVLLFLAA